MTEKSRRAGANQPARNEAFNNNDTATSSLTPHKPQALLTDIDSLATSRAAEEARFLRQRRLADIVAFGERPIIELVDGFAHDPPADAADLDCRIARAEARLDAIGPDLLRALGGDRLPPPLPLRLIEDD